MPPSEVFVSRFPACLVLSAAVATAVCAPPALATASSAATNGTPVTAFGSRGFVEEPLTSGATSSTQAATLNVFAAASGVLEAVTNYTFTPVSSRTVRVYRLTSSGQRDASFGLNGVLDLPSDTTSVLGVDGQYRFYVLEQRASGMQAVLTRFTPNGQADPAYGASGSASFACGDGTSESDPYGAVTSKGEVGLLCASTSSAPTPIGAGITLVTTSADGASTQSGVVPDGSRDLVAGPAGSWFVDAPDTYDSGNRVRKYTAALIADSTFGSGGVSAVVSRAFGLLVRDNDLLVLDGGQITALRPDGSLETGFGSGGRATAGPLEPFQLVGDAAGNLDVFGAVGNNGTGQTVVNRLTHAGTQETGFASYVLKTPSGKTLNAAAPTWGLVVGSDGTIYVGGQEDSTRYGVVGALVGNGVADNTAPTAAMTRPTTFLSLSTSLSVAWAGSDAGAGIGNFDVRYSRALYNASFGALTYPSSWQGIAAHTQTLSGAPLGSTYCFSVRARDRSRNVSGWTARKCTTVALDDRALTASSGWTRSTARGFYRGTYTGSSHLGATLTLKGAHTSHLVLIATKCPTCGKVGIYLGTSLLQTVDLKASTIQRMAAIALTRFSSRRTDITLKVLTSGKTIQVDGLASSII